MCLLPTLKPLSDPFDGKKNPGNILVDMVETNKIQDFTGVREIIILVLRV